MSASWQAHIVVDDRLRRYAKVVVFQEGFDGRTKVVNADGTIAEVEDGVVAPGPFFTVPFPALVAIRDAVDEHLGRRVDEKQLEEVRSSLAAERQRLDRVLDAFLRDSKG